jgi:teichuronic acid biosynthesis glycosyltransferase TuaH
MANELSETPLLSGKTLFFISLPRHDARYTSTPWQIAAQLAKTNRVIFTDHPYTFADLITKFKEASVRKRLKAYLGQYTFEKEGVHVILPPFVWPVNFLPKGKLYNFFSGLNQRMIARRVNRFMDQQGISAMIYVNSFNFYHPLLHTYLNARPVLNIYHCIDPMVKAFTLKHGLYLQDIAASNADLIISTAPALQKNFGKVGYEKSFLVPNAANYKLFSQATTGLEVHSKLTGIGGKVLGYFGNIERRTDFKLLRGVLDILQNWQLVMAGPVEKKYVPEEFLRDSCVHFTGPFPHDEAPAVVKRFDVAIIPFQRDEVSSGIYPLKLYEYLAAGKPVVSTNFNPEILQELNNVIHAADTPEDFANAVLLAYATDSEEKISERQQLASRHTWENRARRFGEIILTELSTTDEPQPMTLKNTKPKSIKDRVKGDPRLKKLALSLIFRPKPNGSRVRWYIWLWLIFPKYFRSGVNWGSRLDLTPFNQFKLGKYSRIEQGVVINNGMGDVIIHDEVHTGIGCIIIGPVTLHKHVGLSQYVRILGMHHGSDVLSPHHHQPSWRAPVILEEDAFIGTGTVIMGKKSGEPLVLGRYCRVGANSVVTTDIPPYSVAVGNPARVVRVWDFDKNCWVKPGSDSAPKVTDNTVEKIDLSAIPEPRLKQPE